MSILMSTARTLAGSAANVATTGVRTGMAVATHLTLGVRRLLRPDASAPPVEPVVPDPVAPGPTDPVVPDPEDPNPGDPNPGDPNPGEPGPPPIPDPAPQPDPVTPGMVKPPTKRRAADVPLKSEPTPSSAAPPEPEGPDAPLEELGSEGATGHAEPEPLLDPATAKQIRSETDTLRRAAR